MRILIAGGSGFIGSNLVNYLTDRHQVDLLTRSINKNNTNLGYYKVFNWSSLDSIIADYDIVINLCGKNIAGNLWTKKYKNLLIKSRIDPTNRLASLTKQHDIWLINASAVGWYNFTTKQQTENYIIPSPANSQQGFSQYLVNLWESAVQQTNNYTILRFGVVLGYNGGMLPKLIQATNFNLAAKLGSGKQMLSWISIHDLCLAIAYIINNNIVQPKIFNLTSTEVTTQVTLVNQLATLLAKWRLLALPQSVIKILLGDMGREMMLESLNIYPENLLNCGFILEYTSLFKSLEYIVVKGKNDKL